MSSHGGSVFREGNTHMQLRNRVARLAATIGITLAAVTTITAPVVVAATPASAATTVTGTVYCDDNANVEGVWVVAPSGVSGWAAMDHSGGTVQRVGWSYGNTNGGSYSLHVGCGGTPSNWAVPAVSGTLTGSGHALTCYSDAGTPLYGKCQ